MKEAAILGVGVSVARFADALPPAEVQSVLKLLLERLRRVLSLDGLYCVLWECLALNAGCKLCTSTV